MCSSDLGAVTALDVDGDGTDELAVSAVGMELVEAGDSAGVVYLFRDVATGGQEVTDAVSTKFGEPYALFGASMVAGDVDGDGAEDLVVGAMTWDVVGDYLVIDGTTGW